jgi:hypothetical protein
MYIWLMAHSTGALQMAISQPLQDEVNHLAKFWGIARWSFGNSALSNAIATTKQLLQLSKEQSLLFARNWLYIRPYHLPNVAMELSSAKRCSKSIIWRIIRPAGSVGSVGRQGRQGEQEGQGRK